MYAHINKKTHSKSSIGHLYAYVSRLISYIVFECSVKLDTFLKMFQNVYMEGWGSMMSGSF